MAKSNPKEVEMNTMHRSGSANRFQVNLVNHDERTGGGGGGETGGGLNGNADVPTDEDTFPEVPVQRRTSRLQSLRPSFRDKERKNSQTTRFKMDENNGSDSNDDEEDNLIDDNKYARSFRHFTREALPRVDNYRNILSFQANNRPTLDELHHASITNKVGFLSRCEQPVAWLRETASPRARNLYASFFCPEKKVFMLQEMC
ncbi:uncharacterized protein LOC131684083 [Topomyia yanbarensis]|uniref:uncharacterized protein LOC131684083 n=1 Tax=Topomyia yanbarensis TaxID=2498891 RepID=UPI00273CBC77|nr:uncharacterized protein LOC131684083 [Topomyia yanbarensis]XP_058822613.1 uncharacterized protein LOC131684083 [Topomyia yanbarensis]XP_058822614.1 uncharacterized protein LOC131684083 [Topomyia yanbarensis]XP_058822615.1 uncharacterized protein LOC131684083 [Topomyia yanbarensis]XP_058822616.1 uncharacterized protein LOC131684083 [Topomyia yanbarensis]XP_058822617.1 uncharacterized protein LOC131684083 [Topomyia yanbarensis]XP_058822618.1 uncharacterized protein LOC131684083 [Topomyia yan